MDQQLMTDEELRSFLEAALSRFSSLTRFAPANWVEQSETTVRGLIDFSKDRKDHFRINLPMSVWFSQDRNPVDVAREFCFGMLKKYDDFLRKHGALPNATKKVLDVFYPDWDLNDSRFMATLSELCFIELMALKKGMTLVEFDSPLSSGKMRNPPNADLKLLWNGGDVFADVKSPTLTAQELDPKVFRANFEKFSEKDFKKKFSSHSTAGVHRTLAYVYKFSDSLNGLFFQGADHLKPHMIQHSTGDFGNAQIYWLKSVTYSDGRRGVFLLDYQYGESSLLSDLNGKV